MASKTLFSLGKLYPSDFLKPDEQPRCEPIELKLMMEDNGLVHLEQTAPKEMMWGKYFYRSGINQSMIYALKNVVDSVLPLMKFKEHDIWCDIASNDGTLLSFVPKSFIRIGIDPAEDGFKKQAEQHADLILQNYFSSEVYKLSQFGQQKVKVITTIAMFYDVQEPEQFIKDVYEILDDDGLWVMQLSYSPLMVYQNAFDNIVHEHWGYYSFNTLFQLLSDNGFGIADAQLNDVNGGSIRLYIMKEKSNHNKYGTQPIRDVCSFRANGVSSYEDYIGFNKPVLWHSFFDKINELKDNVVSFIKGQKNVGKKIWGYGASTKGNTLLQYFGLDNSLIDGIADRNMEKWGLRTVGTNITIYSESDMRKTKPDYLLILPWHFISEFKERESEYLKNGGHFIVPCPQLEII